MVIVAGLIGGVGAVTYILVLLLLLLYIYAIIAVMYEKKRLLATAPCRARTAPHQTVHKNATYQTSPHHTAPCANRRFFGDNDPVFYGNIMMSMLTLFQISTLTSWSAVAGNSQWGCDRWQVSLYGEYDGEGLPNNPDDPTLKAEPTFDTMLGTFPEALCVNPKQVLTI